MILQPKSELDLGFGFENQDSRWGHLQINRLTELGVNTRTLPTNFPLACHQELGYHDSDRSNTLDFQYLNS